MRPLRVLHIAGWYPNVHGPHETPFIPRHIEATRPWCTNTVWHIEVRPGDRWRFTRKNLGADRTYLLETGTKSYLLLEWLATFLIIWAWITRDRSEGHDLVNFHIAYPNCTHSGLLRKVMRLPFVITEHWSAYHTKFNAAKKGTHRIKRIFHQGDRVIVVSEALANDVAGFVGPPRPDLHVVDNAIDPNEFHPLPGTKIQEGIFFTIAGWRVPKRPDVLLEAVAVLRDEGKSIRLRIAGNGPKMPAMLEQIEALGLKDHVDLLGILDAQAVASEVRGAHALVHCSDYETYSAVCAEALCCGTPVVASRVGGIPEFLTSDLGFLVNTNTAADWADTLRSAWKPLLEMDRGLISEKMSARANKDSVGRAYVAVLRKAIAGTVGTDDQL